MRSLAALALAVSIALVACGSVDADWQAASAAGTVAGFQDFLKQHPNGTHADEARARIRSLRDDQAWTLAQNANTGESYQQYLRADPNGAHTQEARDRQVGLLRTAQWKVAQAANTATAYHGYLETYPQGPEADAARAALLRLVNQYRVELGAYRSKRGAAREAKRLNTRYATLLHAVTVVPPEAASKLNRVLSASMSETEARSACAALERQHQRCTVIKS